MTRAGLSVLAVATLVTAACQDDGPRRSLFAAASAASSTDTCAPIPGYGFPVNDHGGEAIEGPTYPITAADSFFQPTCVLRATPGTVTLRVSNTGTLLHNVRITNQDIDIDIVRAESIDIEVELDDTPVVFVCKYHRTSGMVGALLPVIG